MKKNKSLSKTPEKILIIAPAWLGDIVMAQSLFKILKNLSPDCIIDVLAPPWSHPLLNRMQEVNNIFDMPIQHGEFYLGIRYRLGKQLQKKHYHQSIVLPNSWKSALIPLFAKIPIRTGWRGEFRYGLLNDLRTLDKSTYPFMVQRFIALGLQKNESFRYQNFNPSLHITESVKEKTLQKFKLFPTKKPILALCPGAAFGPAKQWPTKHFATLANTKLNDGWGVWIFGSDKEKKIAQMIQYDTASKCTDLTGQTTIAEAIDLLSCATIIVTNDSGLMHIAAALNKPLIALYGSSSPHFTPPLSNKAITLSLNLPCSPCFKRTCPLGHTACLTELNPTQVNESIEKLLQSKSAYADSNS